MKKIKDQLGRKVNIPFSPKRIISLVPSQTELLYDLGLDEEVVGITKFCIHPEQWFRNKERVGGTKKLNLDKIATLQPDLIIGNKEENDELQLKELMDKYPVWMSDICTLPDALEMISAVGEMTGTESASEEMINSIKHRFSELTNITDPKTAAYFIWQKPYMVAGGDTFIHEMMKAAGFQNIFTQLQRYPEVTPNRIRELAPEYILLSSEPYPFKEKHIADFREICPAAKVLLVDGEMFSWYGSRMLKAPAYFKTLHFKL